jgi:uncharacterized protein YndB with AHSA1/START domain
MAAEESSDQQGLELVMTRTLDAPRDLVWRALTDPEHFSKWWGPKPYTAPLIKMDVREGGNLLWAMESPEGVRHFSGGRFTTVKAPGLLACVVYFADENGERIEPATLGFPPDWDGNQTITFTLDDLGDRTRLTMRQTGIPSGEMRHMATAGWLTSIDKLHESLVEGRAMVLERVFDAPRELVWQAWTQREHLDKWWGPDGFTTKTAELDLRVGGVWRHTMKAADGTEFPNRTEYLEIEHPERLVYLLGNEEDHEMARTTVSFMEFAGQTHVNMIVVFKDAEAHDRMIREANAIEGGKQTLARLAEYLSKATG